MLYLLGGENTYESSKRREELTEDFMKRYNGDVKIVDADDVDHISDIFSAADSLSLFEKEILIIVKRALSVKAALQDQILAYLGTSTNTHLIFWEGSSFDKRKKLYKFIQKKGNVEEFKNLPPTQLKSWISKYINGKIEYDPRCIESILLKAGDDQMQIALLLDNLTLLVEADKRKKLTVEDIEEFVEKTTEESIWEFVDALGNNDKKTALLIVEKLVQEKGDFPVIISMIARQFRLLAMTKHLLEKGKSSNEIAGILRQHPFVISKVTSQTYNFTLERLKKLYQKLTQTDLVVKEGRFEEKLALDLLIAAM